MACLLHQGEGREATGILGLKKKLRLAVIVGRSHETVDCRANMACILLGSGAREIAVGNPLPFNVPAFFAGRIDA